MTQGKGDNKSVSERIKEMLVGPGLVFLFVWIIMSMFRIGDPDAWEKIGHDLVVIFCIWVVWCFFLDLKERYSWGVEAKRRRRRRKIERLKMEKRMQSKKDRRIGNKGWFFITAMLFWIGLSAIKIHEDMGIAKLNHTPYRLADSWGDIKDVFIFVFIIWIAVVIIGGVLNRFVGDGVPLGDDD